MGFLKTILKYERVNDANVCTELFISPPNSTFFLFGDLVSTIRKECNASIEKEAGGAIYEEWLIILNSKGRRVNASYQWYGISFTAKDDISLEFLQEIEEIIKTRRYWKW